MNNYTNDFQASQSAQPPPSWFNEAPYPDEVFSDTPFSVDDTHNHHEERLTVDETTSSADSVVPDQSPPTRKPKTGVTLEDMIVRRPNWSNRPPVSQPPQKEPPPPHAWLDAYIEHSRHMSPEGYEHFHEACGIWILSAVAARRINFSLGEAPEYTPLYFMLVAISTEFAKTETANSVAYSSKVLSVLGYITSTNLD